MHRFQPTQATIDFFNGLVAECEKAATVVSGWGGYTYPVFPVTFPSIPPEPIDDLERAFFYNCCMPLYRQLQDMAGTNLVTAPSVYTPPTQGPQAAIAQATYESAYDASYQAYLLMLQQQGQAQAQAEATAQALAAEAARQAAAAAEAQAQQAFTSGGA